MLLSLKPPSQKFNTIFQKADPISTITSMKSVPPSPPRPGPGTPMQSVLIPRCTWYAAAVLGAPCTTIALSAPQAVLFLAYILVLVENIF